MLTLIISFVVGFIAGVLVTRNNIKKVNLLVEEAEKLAAKAEAELKELKAFKHDGFWQCMDNPRDYELLCKHATSINPPWILKCD